MNRMNPADEKLFRTVDVFSDVMTSSEARIGMVNYINTAPIYEVWKRQTLPKGWHVLEANPARLNRLLSEGELDLGFVSSFEYARSPEKYRLLPDLSISASGPVGSVFLFSRERVETGNIHNVLLSSQSETSVALVRIILEEFYHISPVYRSGAVTEENYRDSSAVLAIGDDALRMKKSGEFSHCLDLGEVWSQHTGLPFVFAVCAVREEFVVNHPALLQSVYEKLLWCRNEGLENLAEVSRIAAARIPMPVSECMAYLRCIELDLGGKKKDALAEFFTLLIRRKDVHPGALPLRFVKF